MSHIVRETCNHHMSVWCLSRNNFVYWPKIMLNWFCMFTTCLVREPVLGLSIFTQREVRTAKTDIDPAAVFQHLKSCTIATSSYDYSSVKDTVEPSLSLISSQSWQSNILHNLFLKERKLTPRLHDEAVYLLLDLIQAEVLQNVRLTSRVETQRDAIGILRQKLLQFS